MQVNIRGLVVSVDTLEQLDELIERYGGDGTSGPAPKSATPPESNGKHNRVVQDRIILERLVNAGESGVLSTELGDLLSKRGKAIGPGLREWASRVGLRTDNDVDPVERARPNGAKGWRLRSTFIQVGKRLLGE